MSSNERGGIKRRAATDGGSGTARPGSPTLLRRVVGFRRVALRALLCSGRCTRRAVGIVLRWAGVVHTRRCLVVLHGAARRPLTNVLRTHRVAVAIGTPLCGSDRRAADSHDGSNADPSTSQMSNRSSTVTKPSDWPRTGERRPKLWNDTLVGTRGGGASLLPAPVAPPAQEHDGPSVYPRGWGRFSFRCEESRIRRIRCP